jgi:uncharacterized FAD-dependent dehydrogenase
MTIRINNIRVPLEEIDSLKYLASRKISVDLDDIKDFKTVKESIDARRKSRIDFIYSVELSIDGDESAFVERLHDADVILSKPRAGLKIEYGTERLPDRPIIIGSGPAGLFAGLILAKNGYNPVIYERGKSVEERSKIVKSFWRDGDFDPECNVQFGEGGAGTFSDGKLTTRIKDERCKTVLDEFIRCGAPPEIAYDYKPHIGTDMLKSVIANIRKKITAMGGEVRFSSKLTDIKIKDGSIVGITINDNEYISCQVLVLALGHSARDTFEMLMKKGTMLSSKAFAVGFRIEHNQRMIDLAQYGKFANHPKLRAATYTLAYQSKRYNRPCYTFCMCPGGVVVAAASEDKRLVTNGMSEYARDGENANSAVVCGVRPEDFKGEGPLAGIEFQRMLEERAYNLGKGEFKAPVQRAVDFINNKVTSTIGRVKPTYTRGYTLADLNDCLPEELCAVIKEGLLAFDGKIKGFCSKDAILTAVETRTSSPVRIERDKTTYESLNIAGLYPAGEGAGYAGGIVSAAVDGIKVSEQIMKSFAPLK